MLRQQLVCARSWTWQLSCCSNCWPTCDRSCRGIIWRSSCSGYQQFNIIRINAPLYVCILLYPNLNLFSKLSNFTLLRTLENLSGNLIGRIVRLLKKFFEVNVSLLNACLYKKHSLVKGSHFDKIIIIITICNTFLQGYIFWPARKILPPPL